MSTSDGVSYRSYRHGDEVAINTAFNETFHLDRSLAEWGWKFPDEEQGRTIMLAESDGELLAHYAGQTLRFHLDGTVWPAAQIVDVFSVRAARHRFSRRGVWVQTAESFFSTFGESGRLAVLFGFPSPRPLRLGVLQLGYDSMEPQPIVYLRRDPTARRRRLRSRLYRAELARDWEPRLTRFWERVRGVYPAAAVRDAEYALRRFAGRPGVQYHRFLILPRFSTEALGWVVFRSDGGVLRWVDLLWDHAHPGVLELAVALGARMAAQVGATHEEMWLNGDPEGTKHLQRQGFDVLPEPRKLVMVARCFAPDFDLHSLENRVYVTMADSDLE